MNRVTLRQILLALALLAVPCAGAAREPMAGSPARAGESWSVAWDFLSPLWSRAVRWASKNGPSIDPDGSLSPAPKNGPSIDPNGHTSTSPLPAGSSVRSDAGCTLDPDGCAPTYFYLD